MSTKKKGAVPQVVLVLSDLHCGSDVAVLPTEVTLDDGQTLGHGKNKLQKWLWDKFQETQALMLEKIGNAPFVLVLNGDLIEGMHHRSVEVVSAKMVEHLAIARAVLGPLVERAHTTHVIKGTEVHTYDFERVFAKEMGLGDAYDFIQFKVNDVLIDARHHMSCTSRLHLESTALGVLAANNRSNAIRAGHEPARVFLRGHRHIPGTYSDGEVLVAATGAWQGLTRHGAKVVADSISRPSMLLLDWRGLPKGHLPSVTHTVCNPPQQLVAHCLP